MSRGWVGREVCGTGMSTQRGGGPPGRWEGRRGKDTVKGRGERRDDSGGGIREAQGRDLSAVRPGVCRKVGGAMAELVCRTGTNAGGNGMGRGRAFGGEGSPGAGVEVVLQQERWTLVGGWVGLGLSSKVPARDPDGNWLSVEPSAFSKGAGDARAVTGQHTSHRRASSHHL